MTATVTVALAALANGMAAFGFNLVATRQIDADMYAGIGVLWTLQYLWIAIGVTAIEAYTTRTVVLAQNRPSDLARFVRALTVGLVLVAGATAALSLTLRTQLFDGAMLFAPIAAALVLTYGLYGVVRGEAAGRQRFFLYATLTAGESVLRLIFAVIFFAVSSRPELVYLVFPAGPLLMLLAAFTPKTRARNQTGEPVVREPASRFFMSAIGANTAVQLLIAGGPLFLVVLGAQPAAIAIFFTTQTAARLPLSIAINGGLSRLLPPLIETVQRGDATTFRRHAITIGIAVVGTTIAALAGGIQFGPALLDILFGADFRPEALFTATIFAGAVLTFGGLFVNQLYIALGQEKRLTPVWWSCLTVAALAAAFTTGDVGLRVAVSFSVATLAASLWLLFPLLRKSDTLPF
jgi:hypothetical protein